VVALHGELDFSEKARIERELSQIDKFGPGAITILDLSGVRYVDPTILNSLIGVRKRLERDQPGSSVCIVAPRTNFVWRVFEVTQLDKIFRIFADVEEAHNYACTTRESLNDVDEAEHRR